MRKASAFTLLFICLCGSIVQAGPVEKEEFFNESIGSEIQVCEFKAGLIGSSSEVLRSQAESAHARIDFYQGHQAELVEQMIAQEVPQKSYAVKYFLNKAYGHEVVKVSRSE